MDPEGNLKAGDMDIAAEAREALENVQQKLEELTSFVNSVLSKVPDMLSYIVDRFMDAWNWMLEKLGEFWDWFTDKLSYAGNPFVLGGAATAWRQSVAGPMTNVVRSIDDAQLAADDVWEGFGAEQYRQHLPAQREAMSSIAGDFAETVASVLDSIQTAIIVFWGGVVVAIASLAFGIAAATASGATIVGLPAVPAAVAAAVGVAVTSLGVTLAILYSNASSARSTLASTASGVSSWPAFAS